MLLHIFTAAAAGLIQFVNGKWGQASREVLAWKDSFGFRRGRVPWGHDSPPPQRKTHNNFCATACPAFRLQTPEILLSGWVPGHSCLFFSGHRFSVSFFFFFFGAFPCPRIFCGVWEFSPLSDTNYLRLLAAAAANAMATTVDGGEHS